MVQVKRYRVKRERASARLGGMVPVNVAGEVASEEEEGVVGTVLRLATMQSGSRE